MNSRRNGLSVTGQRHLGWIPHLALTPRVDNVGEEIRGENSQVSGREYGVGGTRPSWLGGNGRSLYCRVHPSS